MKHNNKHRTEIESVFGPHALTSPIFYLNPGGLRFELSAGGSYIHQFITAQIKAREICNFIFEGIDEILLCCEYFGKYDQSGLLSVARSLKEIELWPQATKEYWFVPEADNDILGQHIIAFKISMKYLDNILWSNISSDLGVRPSASCRLHMFDFNRSIHVFPYDDRGMDVVGPNHDMLKKVYLKYYHYLLDSDIDSMKETFQ